MAMTNRFWTRRHLAFIVVILALACPAAFLSVEVIRPTSFTSAALGAEWQCSKTLMMTSCTRAVHAEPLRNGPHNEPVCTRRV
jgi:hypothetical protein